MAEKRVDYKVSVDYLRANDVPVDDIYHLRLLIKRWYIEHRRMKVNPFVEVVEEGKVDIAVHVPGGDLPATDAKEAWNYAITTHVPSPAITPSSPSLEQPEPRIPAATLNDVLQSLRQIEEQLKQPVSVKMDAGDAVNFGCWLSLGLLVFSTLTGVILLALMGLFSGLGGLFF